MMKPLLLVESLLQILIVCLLAQPLCSQARNCELIERGNVEVSLSSDVTFLPNKEGIKSRDVRRIKRIIKRYDNAINTIHVVTNSDELSKVLQLNSTNNLILLKGDRFVVNRDAVFVGGVITNYPGYNATLLGAGQNLSNIVARSNGYCLYAGDTSILASGMMYSIVDDEFGNVSLSRLSNVFDGELPRAGGNVIKANDETLLVKIPMTVSVKRLLADKTSDFFKYSTLILSGAFVDVALHRIYSDADYLYGYASLRYFYDYADYEQLHYGVLPKYDIINLPIEGYGAYIDQNDFVHVPTNIMNPYLSTNAYGLLFDSNDRHLIFDCLTFVGGGSSAFVQLQNTSNKKFVNCQFINMHNAIAGGSNTNIDINNCHFDNIGAQCVAFESGRDCIVENCYFYDIGTFYKGYYAVRNAGQKAQIINNRFDGFSCGAIFVGNTTNTHSSATVSGNVIDNSRWLDSFEDNCARDFGGIYVSSYADSILIENNIIRNISSQSSSQAGETVTDGRGIFMDEGANNTTISGNVIYNINGSYVLDSRDANSFVGHNTNNTFSDNVLAGKVRVHGNPDASQITVLCRNNVFDEKYRIDSNDFVRFVDNRTCRISTDGNYVHLPSDYRRVIDLEKNLRVLIKYSSQAKKE